MNSKLAFLSLGLLLIALLNAQLMAAQPHHYSQADHHQYNGVGWGFSQPMRHDGHFQHRHPNGHNQFNDRYAGGGYQGGSQYGPMFGGGSSRERQFGGAYADQYGPGYGSQRPGAGFEGRPGGRFGHQQPGAGAVGEQPEFGYGRQQPGAEYDGHRHGAVFGAGSRGQSVDHSRSFQPRPDYAQQPDQPAFSNGQWDNPIQPRPQPDYQTPGNANNPLQPRPEVGAQYPTEFQQPGQGQSGNPIEPRPTDYSKFNFQQPGETANPNPIQPLPGTNYPTGFQQPSHGPSDSTIQPQPGTGHSNKPIEPRPTDYSKFNFQQPNESNNPNPIQPLPGKSQQQGAKPETDAGLQQFGNEQVGSTIQPRPSSDGIHSRLKPGDGIFSGPAVESSGTVDDNIASIFNTKGFLYPNLNEGDEHHGSQEDQGVVLADRNLFDTPQQCTAGTSMRGGRCRTDA